MACIRRICLSLRAWLVSGSLEFGSIGFYRVQIYSEEGIAKACRVNCNAKSIFYCAILVQYLLGQCLLFSGTRRSDMRCNALRLLRTQPLIKVDTDNLHCYDF